jgi:isopentenyl-diphosphate delta-isomerase type 1
VRGKEEDVTNSPELVVLLSDDGREVGTALKATVHTSRTPLHRAFSLYVFNPAGQVLLTRRALSKQAWPGVWTNSCCGHPGPDEDVPAAARRRARYELGLDVRDVVVVDEGFSYVAVDDSGIMENEWCPIGVTVVDGPIEPNPSEVMAHAWVDWSSYRALVPGAPRLLSPWAVEQFASVDGWVTRHGAGAFTPGTGRPAG